MTARTELRLDDQLCFALYAASNTIVRAYRPLLAELGLTYPQYIVMMVLWEADDVSVQAIGRRLDLPPHGVTPILTRLVEAGLVGRAADPRDARVTRIRLTATGAGLEAAAAQAQAAVVCRTGLSSEALDELRERLQDLTAATRDEST